MATAAGAGGMGRGGGGGGNGGLSRGMDRDGGGGRYIRRGTGLSAGNRQPAIGRRSAGGTPSADCSRRGCRSAFQPDISVRPPAPTSRHIMERAASPFAGSSRLQTISRLVSYFTAECLHPVAIVVWPIWLRFRKELFRSRESQHDGESNIAGLYLYKWNGKTTASDI